MSLADIFVLSKEPKSMIDRDKIQMVECAICKKECGRINYLHLRKHNISLAEYKEKFPNLPLDSPDVLRKIGEGARQNWKDLVFRNKVLSVESRIKQRETLKKRYASGELIAWCEGKKCPQISESKKKYKFTSEHKEHLTEANRRIWNNKSAEEKEEQIQRFVEAGREGNKQYWEKMKNEPINLANKMLLTGSDKYTLYVDSREPEYAKEQIKKMENVDVSVKVLPCGDYWLMGARNIILERKTVNDFLGSVASGRLWTQLKMLKEVENAEPYLLIEGNFDYAIKWRKWNENKVIALLDSVIFDWGILILYSPSKVWTPYVIADVLKRFVGIPKDKHIHPINIKPKLETIEEKVLYVLESFPNVGPQTARKLYELGVTLPYLFEQVICEDKDRKLDISNILNRTQLKEMQEILRHFYAIKLR